MYCAEAHAAGTVDAFYGVKRSEAFAITGPERFGQSRPAWRRRASHTVIRRLSDGSYRSLRKGRKRLSRGEYTNVTPK
jgi:hypothetical protein